MSESVKDGLRFFHYRTSKEQTGATLRWGKYAGKAAEVGDMQVVVYAKMGELTDFKNRQFVVTEMANMLSGLL